MQEITELIEVAAKKRAAEMVILNGNVVNVYSGEILRSDIAIYKGNIAYVGTSPIKTDEATEIIDARDYYLVPGYIEPHGHMWIVANPLESAKKFLLTGVTTCMSDVASFFAQQGREKFKVMAKELTNYPFNFYWNLNIMYPTPDSAEENIFADMSKMWEIPQVTGVAEIPRWIQVYQGKKRVLQEIVASHQAGKLVECHTAGASYERLNAIAAAGVDGDHEAINATQALERLRLGLWTILRNSSLRRDLDAWVEILQDDSISSNRLMLTTDGSSPMYVSEYGAIDYILSSLVEKGVNPIKALQLATINPATYYNFDSKLGGIAPGRKADILFLESLSNFRPQKTIVSGRLVVNNNNLITGWPKPDWNHWGMSSPYPKNTWASKSTLYGFSEKYRSQQGFPVMNLVSTVITRPLYLDLPVVDGKVEVENEEGLLNVSLLDKRGTWAKQALLKGFAKNLDGYACSYSANGNILVLGKKTTSMALAAQRLVDLGGGIVLVDNNDVVHQVPLPIAGVMAEDEFNETVSLLAKMEQLLQERGYIYDDFLYSSLFLPTDHLPDWRITEYGVLDVKTGQILY